MLAHVLVLLWQDYPYVALDGICRKDSCDVVPGTAVDKWVDVENSEEVRTSKVAGRFVPLLCVPFQ